MAARLHAVPQGAVYAVGYVRVSTAREEMISPEIQEQAIRDLCARRGYVLRKIIEDLDATGRNFARKGVNDCIAMVERGEVSAIIVWKYSRFGRNRRGWALNVARVEEDAGGRLESATEDVDASTSTGKLTRGMLAEINAWTSDNISDQWKEAHEHRLATGLPHTGGPRFGYIYHRATVTTRYGWKRCPQDCEPGACKTSYVPDYEGVAPFAGAMYEMYNRGLSFRRIARELNARGAQTTVGGLWTAIVVRRYMDSGFAAGLLREHATHCACKAPMTCSQATYRKGAHKALVEPDVWDAYQQSRTQRRSNAPRVESPVYPLAGFVRCDDACKGPMAAASSRNRNGEYVKGHMYRCALRARLGKEACAGRSIPRSVVEDYVLKWLGERATVDWEKEAARRPVSAASRVVVKTDRERLKRQVAELAAALTRLTVNHAKGLVPDAAYETSRDELLAEQAPIQQSLDDTAEQPDNYMTEEHVRVAKGLVAEWHTLAVDDRRELLSKLIRRINISSTDTDRITIDPTWDAA